MIIDEALRVGPSGGFFAARLVRDLVLIDALERKSQCDPKQACCKPDIIAGFPVDDEDSPSNSKGWQALIAGWKEFRDRDALRSRACLDVARKLPTFDLPLVAMNDLESKGQAGHRDDLPPALKPIEPKRPKQGDIDRDCRKRVSDLLANRPIYFSSEKSSVRSADRKFLTDVAGFIASCHSLQIALVGHTDSDGTRTYNQRLSRLRAEAVARILRSAAAVRLEISGMGERRPVRPNTSRANKAYNRRVTIEVL